MSILCQFPGTRRIRASGKLKENGGWGRKQEGCFTDKPIVSMQSAALYCGDGERESVCVFSDLPAASSLSETNKTTVSEIDRGKSRFFCCTHN